MKKTLSLLLSLMLCILCLPALGEEDTYVSVSITDDTGALVLALESVLVNDTDSDGLLTINDALACAHHAHPDGMAAYATAQTEWGLSLLKLWGVENGGSYGYYLNDASAFSLTDPVKGNDHVKAYVFTDLNTFSDTYCYFDATYVETSIGETVELTLTAATFDENYAPIAVPVAGATLVIDGELTDIITDAEGKVNLTIVEDGSYLISADHPEMNLVDSVCIVQAH